MNFKELKTGDIVIEHTKFRWNKPLTYLSLMIRIFQWLDVRKRMWARWNHSGVIYVSTTGVPYVIDAVAKGLTMRRYEVWTGYGRKEWMVIRPIGAELLPGDRKKMLDAVGTPYDFWALLTQAIHILTLGILWIGPKGDKAIKKLYCSEFAAWVWKFMFKDWYKIHTAELLSRIDFDVIELDHNYGTEG